jgi:hypothetical protein
MKSHKEDGPGTSSLKSREIEERKRDISTAEFASCRTPGNSLVVLQVNYRSVYKKVLEFWNLVDTYNPDVVIGTE